MLNQSSWHRCNAIHYVEHGNGLRRCAMVGLHGNVDHIIYVDQLSAMVYMEIWNPDIKFWFKL
jgi:hypothetical protein